MRSSISPSNIYRKIKLLFGISLNRTEWLHNTRHNNECANRFLSGRERPAVDCAQQTDCRKWNPSESRLQRDTRTVQTKHAVNKYASCQTIIDPTVHYWSANPTTDECTTWAWISISQTKESHQLQSRLCRQIDFNWYIRHLALAKNTN
jgi:hypothetical protein